MASATRARALALVRRSSRLPGLPGAGAQSADARAPAIPHLPFLHSSHHEGGLEAARPAIGAGSTWANGISRSSSAAGLVPLRMLSARWMSGCQLRLGAPPPPKVVVEYAEGDPKSLERFISLANDIEGEFPDIVVEGNPEESTARDGAFEVTYGNSTLFSRFKELRLPDSEEVMEAFRREYRPEPSAVPLGCK